MACRVTSVALESTGVYWIPVYEILEARGIAVHLVNARHVRNVPGRKSDVSDAEWLRDLHSVGLLRGSFRPTEAIAALRAYVRHRHTLVELAAMHIQRMQKALMQMNLQLPSVLSDITGQTGLRIIRAIVAGERDPAQLATHRHGRCRASEAEIIAALTGHYRPEHLFALQQNLALFDACQLQMEACDRAIEAHVRELTATITAPGPLPAARAARQRTDPPSTSEPCSTISPAASISRKSMASSLHRPQSGVGDRHRHATVAQRAALHLVADARPEEQGVRRAAPQRADPTLGESRRRGLPLSGGEPRPHADGPRGFLSAARRAHRQTPSDHGDGAEARGAGLPRAQGRLRLSRSRCTRYDAQQRPRHCGSYVSARIDWGLPSSVARPERCLEDSFLGVA